MDQRDLRQEAREALCDVGIDQFNAEHCELLYNFFLLQSFLQEISERGERPEDWSQIEQSIAFLEEYAHTHLRAEETLMKASNFAGFAAHKLSHDHFLSDFIAIKDKISQSHDLKYVHELNGFLIEWIFKHTSNVDMEYKGLLDLSKLEK
ncbi:MAG: hemerythrin domain-containing protein [Magnetococcales bacterium]|nr:hemerythrin domain-containing protein [Magnetococcales bacterium]